MEERKKRSGVLFDFIRGAYIPGALGASLACLFTNPIEVVKTRMQLQGELTASGNFVKTYKNPIQAFSVIYHNEGIKGIQKGLGPAVGYQVIMNGFRLGSYGPILKLLNVEHSSSQAELVGKRLIAGASAGAIGAVMGSPLYLIKTRMQSQSPTFQIGSQHHYTSTLHAVKEIYSKEGWLGLMRGANVAGMRIATGSSVQLATYDTTKHYLLNLPFLSHFNPESTTIHFASAMVTGIFVTVCMNPFDVMTTRLYNQKVVDGKGTIYSGIFDCFKKMTKTEGLYGFYKGWWAHYFRIGPHTVLTFIFFEKLKSFVQMI